jgi:hypothetical protein
MITHFNDTACRLLQKKIAEALDGIEGLDVKVGGLRYDVNSATVRITFDTPAAAEDRAHTIAYALKLHGVKTASVPGYEIIDYHDRKPKYPFIVEHKGKKWKYSPTHARETFGAV